MKTSKRMSGISGQPMFSIMQVAQAMEREGKKIYHFELGDSDFNTPDSIINSAHRHMLAGRVHYSPSQGEYALLKAAQKVTLKSRGFKPDIEQLLVTPGANMQIYLALACICDPGDNVIIPTPYFPSYPSQVKSLGIRPVSLDVDKATYKISPIVLECLCMNYDIRALILNYPNNPTGMIYTKAELGEIYRVAQAHDIYIIADEVYSRMIYDGEFTSLSKYDHCRERVIVVNGFSKSFGMTGWRVGVATGPSVVISEMTILLETICSCVCQFIQDAAADALMSDQDETMQQIEEYRKRRDVMVSCLSSVDSLNLECVPQGGLYCWAKIANGMSSKQYAKEALELGVVLTPGWVFGQDDHVRFAFTTGIPNITMGIKELACM